MSRVYLVHNGADGMETQANALRTSGFEVDTFDNDGDYDLVKKSMVRWRKAPPEVFVLDMTRRPSVNKYLGVMIRGRESFKTIPIVYAGGDAEKMEPIKRAIPDAVFSSWRGAVKAIRKALVAPVETPAKKPQIMDLYKDRTVCQKLGIEEGMRVGIVDPPRELESLLTGLPEGVELVEETGPAMRVTLWFVRDYDLFLTMLTKMIRVAAISKLWVAFPKKRPGSKDTINQKLVREAIRAAGLVEYKICSMGDVWSAMAFSARKSDA